MSCYKYTKYLYDAFIDTFSYLPVCAIVNDTTFCVYGGLSPQLDHVEDIEKNINRPIHHFEENSLLTDLVWGDPYNGYDCQFGDNPRGMGYLFNRVAVNNFLSKNEFKRIIRAHECVKKGVLKIFDDRCITVFSASSYDKNLGNSSGLLELFQQDDRIELKIFDPIERLKKVTPSILRFRIRTTKMK